MMRGEQKMSINLLSGVSHYGELNRYVYKVDINAIVFTLPTWTDKNNEFI